MPSIKSNDIKLNNQLLLKSGRTKTFLKSAIKVVATTMKNKSIHLSLKLFVYTLAIIFGVASICLPHWTQKIKAQRDECMPVDRVTNSGLWWTQQYLQIQENNETSWNYSEGQNIKTVRGLMCFGVVVLSLYSVIIWVYMCCWSDEKDKRPLLWTCWAGIFAAFVVGSAVLVFFAAVKKDNETLSSGFWLAVISDILAFIIGIYDIVMTCCKYRNSA